MLECDVGYLHGFKRLALVTLDSLILYRPPTPSHGLCTSFPKSLKSRRNSTKKFPHQFQQIAYPLLQRSLGCSIYGPLSRKHSGKASCRGYIEFQVEGSLKSSVHAFYSILFYRMYPVVPVNARIITEKDINVGGYHFPKNVGQIYFLTQHHLEFKNESIMLCFH